MMYIRDKKTDKKKKFSRVTLDGDLDKVGLDNIRADLDSFLAASETQNFVLDLTDLQFINSEGVGYLLTIHYRLLKRDMRLVLVGAKSHVKDVLDVIGMLNIVSYFETFELFEKSL